MFDVFNSLVQKASGTAKKCAEEGYEWIKQTGVMDLEEGFNDEEVENPTHNEDGSVCADGQPADISVLDPHVTKNLLSGLPRNWESPAEEWRMLADAALREENGSIIPPSTITGNTEITEKVFQLIGIDSAEALPHIPEKGACLPTKDVIEMLSSSSDFLQFRSSVVPRYVSEEQYWINIWWRFHIYHMCRNSFQLLDVMNAVTTEPNPLDETGNHRGKEIGVPNSESYWKQLRDVITANRVHKEKILEQVKAVKDEIEHTSANLQYLTNIIKKGEINELGNSVFESSRYHKAKIERFIADLKAQQEEVGDSTFSESYGSLFQQLLDLKGHLHSRIDAYVALENGNPSEAWKMLSYTENDEMPHAGKSPVALNDAEAVFEAALPWEQDVQSKRDDDKERLYHRMSIAFPLLRKLGETPRLTKVDPSGALAARRLLFGPSCAASDGFDCSYCVGAGLAIPVRFIGTSAECGSDAVLAHVPGLPGAFPVAAAELRRHRRLFAASPCGDSGGLALLCAAEALDALDALYTAGPGGGIGEGRVLDSLFAAARRRLASLRGTEALLRVGGRIHAPALQLSFPYHAGAAHATRRYFDTTREACQLFCPHAVHGTKVLCRYGVAVAVGVAPDAALECPALHWHPAGAPAACIAPHFAACHSVPVGEARLEPGGPAPHSPLLDAEDPARYMNPTLDGVFDTTTWLNEGLFGVRPGDTIGDEGEVVHGVRYNERLREFELHVRDTASGEVRLCTESLFV